MEKRGRVRKEGKEDYLRAIYELYDELEKEKGIKSVEIAYKLKVSKPSVSEMLRKLATQGLVNIKPYSKIFLTTRGKKHAEKLFDKHFAIKNFMKKILRYDDKRAREEAHKLEHAFSHESAELLNKIIERKYEEEPHEIIKPLPGYIG